MNLKQRHERIMTHERQVRWTPYAAMFGITIGVLWSDWPDWSSTGDIITLIFLIVVAIVVVSLVYERRLISRGALAVLLVATGAVLVVLGLAQGEYPVAVGGLCAIVGGIVLRARTRESSEA